MDTKALVVARRARFREAIESRQMDVEAMMALQVDPRQITEKIVEKHKVSAKTVQRDINVVWAKWDAESRGDRPRYREQARRTLRRVIQAAFAAKKYGDVVRAQTELSKIDGLHALEKHEHTFNGIPAGTVTELELSVHQQMARMTSGEKREKLKQLVGKYSHPISGEGQPH